MSDNTDVHFEAEEINISFKVKDSWNSRELPCPKKKIELLVFAMDGRLNLEVLTWVAKLAFLVTCADSSYACLKLEVTWDSGVFLR